MKYLLDTCALIFLVTEPGRLKDVTRRELNVSGNDLFILSASAWELACAVARGRFQPDRQWREWFRHYADLFRCKILPIDLATIEEAAVLPPPIHNDPIDRLTIAQSRLDGMKIVTTDTRILHYPHCLSTS